MKKSLIAFTALIFMLSSTVVFAQGKKDRDDKRGGKRYNKQQEQVQTRQRMHKRDTRSGQRDKDRERRMERGHGNDWRIGNRDYRQQNRRHHYRGPQRYHNGRDYKYGKHNYRYRGHHDWQDWNRNHRQRYPEGRYYRDSYGQLMFSFCQGPGCFSFSIGD